MTIDQIPDGCNFFCTIRTAPLDLESVAKLFADAGWRVNSTVNLVGLESDNGCLTLEKRGLMILQGSTTEPKTVLDLLARPGYLVSAKWRDEQHKVKEHTQWPWLCPSCGTLSLVRWFVSSRETFHCSECHRDFRRHGRLWETVLSEEGDSGAAT